MALYDGFLKRQQLELSHTNSVLRKQCYKTILKKQWSNLFGNSNGKHPWEGSSWGQAKNKSKNKGKDKCKDKCQNFGKPGHQAQACKKPHHKTVHCDICLIDVPTNNWGTHVDSKDCLDVEFHKPGCFCNVCSACLGTNKGLTSHIDGAAHFKNDSKHLDDHDCWCLPWMEMPPLLWSLFLCSMTPW